MKTIKMTILTLMLTLIIPEISDLNAQINTSMSKMLENYNWRAIGPANMGGRVTDIDGVPGDPSTFYVSGADRSIFKTTNGGVSFNPIFENQRAYSIGALTIALQIIIFFGLVLVKEIKKQRWIWLGCI